MELKADTCQLRGKQYQDGGADHAATKRRPHTQTEGQTGPTLARHREAVKGGGNRRGRARYAGENAGHQAA